MGKRGPKGVPNTIKIANGTYDHSHHGNAIDPVGEPECPSYLTEAAKKHWASVTADLRTANTLCRTDSACIGIMCEILADIEDATRQFRGDADSAKFTETLYNDNGSVKYEQLSQLVPVLHKLRAQFKQFACEFGLTASARSGLHVQAKKSSGVSNRKSVGG